MLQTTSRATKTANATSLLDLLKDGGEAFFASIRKRRRAARDHRVVAHLSEAQLADAGIDRSSIQPPRPSFEIEAGLMAKLMSMR